MHTCISSHGLKRSGRSCPRWVNAGNKNTPSTHHPRRRNVTTLMVGLKKKQKTVTYTKISPKSGEPQRYSSGTKKKKKKKKKGEGAGIAQSKVCWACCPAWSITMASILLTASGRRDFPLELTQILTPFPKKTLLDDSINRGLVCAHTLSIAQLKRSWHSCPCWQQKHPQHTPSTKTVCD